MGRLGVSYGLLQIAQDNRIIDVLLEVEEEIAISIAGVIT